MISMLFLRASGGSGCLSGCRSSSSGIWSRLVVTGILLGLVALENALLAADRLQFFLDERGELEQLADVGRKRLSEWLPVE